jgi:wyosine [tRNA(Phe)-imidazoG37] synthetase (radical SAM superfamily)
MNLNPDRKCNFDCLYCEVDRSKVARESILDCEIAGRELEKTLLLLRGGDFRTIPPYDALPPELLRLRHVALSGDGEPTASPVFLEAIQTVVHVRARGLFPFFKIVLITNGSCLDSPDVQAGLRFFTSRDEIWAKLDVGTQRYMDVINRSAVPLETILQNILQTATKRPVIIQSLFSSIDGMPPSTDEIKEFAERLRELKERGANISMVQIYSATRPGASMRVRHLPLRTMSQIAETVRNSAGIRTEVF